MKHTIDLKQLEEKLAFVPSLPKMLAASSGIASGFGHKDGKGFGESFLVSGFGRKEGVGHSCSYGECSDGYGTGTGHGEGLHIDLGRGICGEGAGVIQDCTGNG
jgi:hypothetical protein